MSTEAKILIGISIVTLIIVIGGALFFGGKPTAQEQQSAEPIENTDALIREDSNVMGPKDAPITLVEFGDFQCPACGTAHPIVTQLLGEYKGKIKFVYRNFPLQMHQNAAVAHLSAEAAGEQGKFFEMYDALYAGQKEWENQKDPFPTFKEYAEKLGLDVDQFTKAVEEKKYQDKIQKDIDDGYAVGVNSTPTFFINGVKQVGGLDYADFKKRIDDIINKK